ncbi:Similar to SCAP: Sterol regulatory element-binding protein cleavage-activating protein (Sus scrofa), partial [Cotesia congregata]
SPPSRGEFDSQHSFGLYSAATGPQKSPGSNNYQRIEQIKKRHSTHSLDYEYHQINEFPQNEKRKSLGRLSNRGFEFPDFRPLINTKFNNSPVPNSAKKNYENGFDYGDNYKKLFTEHIKTLDDIDKCGSSEYLTGSTGTLNNNDLLTDSATSLNTNRTTQSYNIAPIWCVDYQDNIIVVGCANGALEFWEGTTGLLKCFFDDGSGLGISAVKLVYNRVVAAKLNGSVDFLELEQHSEGHHVGWGFTSGRRTHVRTGSAGSPMDLNLQPPAKEEFRCIKKGSHRAHQQAITVLDSEGGRVVTGSQDHTLKVFRLEDLVPMYTLHGHCGPISCLFIDRISPMTSGSGSQDGLLCVWDLLNGTCVYSIQAHDGAIAAITCSASYVISIGTDERLCVWERFQGHLLHTLPAHRAAYSLQ